MIPEKESWQARFESISLFGRDGLLVLNADGLILFCNPAACSMFGKTQDQLVGSPFGFPVLGLDRTELDIPAAGGGRLVVEMRVNETDWDGSPAILTQLRDITRRKQNEEALTYLRSALDASPEGWIASDLSGQILECNTAMCRILACTGAQVRKMHMKDLVTDGSPDRWDAFLADLRTRRERRFEQTVRRQDGLSFAAEVSAFVVTERGQESICAFLRDITEAKALEERFFRAQKLESIGTLAGGIAHDFNNLLSAILGNASLALRELSAEDPAADRVQKVRLAAERAADLTRQLLAYSGRGAFVTTRLNLNQLVTENGRLFEVTLPKTVHMDYDLTEDLPLVLGDSAQIQQVVMNLIINAGEAVTRSGRVALRTSTVTIGPGSRFFSKNAEPLEPGEYVLLEVEDSGSGMSPDVQKRIFEPFFTTKFTGRGLGLASVIGIVHGHGGGLHVKSEPGKGTTFAVALPSAGKAARSEAQALTPEVTHPVEGQLALVIDDEPLLTDLVCEILTAGGFKVMSALNGASGIDLFAQHHREISLVVLDFSMPDMDGREVFERMKGIDPDVRVVLCSGYAESEMSSAFRDSKPDWFLQKPYTIDKMMQVARSLAGCAANHCESAR